MIDNTSLKRMIEKSSWKVFIFATFLSHSHTNSISFFMDPSFSHYFHLNHHSLLALHMYKVEFLYHASKKLALFTPLRLNTPYYFVKNGISWIWKYVTIQFVGVAVSGNTQLGMVMWHWRPGLGPGPGLHHLTMPG